MAFAATASKRGALADMDKAAIDVAKALARLSELTIFELRGEWRRPPMWLSRDLLIRGITYKLDASINATILRGGAVSIGSRAGFVCRERPARCLRCLKPLTKAIIDQSAAMRRRKSRRLIL